MDEKLDQFEIIREILQGAFTVAEDGWQEMIIDYYIEAGRSCLLKSFIIERDRIVKEESLPDVPHVDYWLRKLQEQLAQAGRPPFTRCKLQVTADGTYNTTYSYDPVDWDALINPDWNFFPRREKPTRV